MKELVGPFSQPGFRKRIAQNILAPFVGNYSGELIATYGQATLGMARTSGRVSDVSLSVGSCGRDDSNTLIITGEIYINGTSCLTTPPSIAGNNGLAGAQKTTKVTGDTGISQAVINASANAFTPGDIFTYKFILGRTATPTTEISNVCILVELEPEI